MLGAMFKPKIIDFALAGARYSLELYEFRFKIYSLRPSIEILATANIADAALESCSSLSVSDKRKYRGALEALAAVLCPVADWASIARTLKRKRL